MRRRRDRNPIVVVSIFISLVYRAVLESTGNKKVVRGGSGIVSRCEFLRQNCATRIDNDRRKEDFWHENHQ